MKFLDIPWQHKNIPDFLKNIEKLIESGMYILGEEVKKFENNWAKYIGTRYCIGVNSGTDALSLGLRATGIKPGSKVLVQTNTFAATVYAIVQNNCIPVFVDIDPEYGCISLKDLKEKIKKEKPQALIIVHLYGQACFASEVKEICQENNIYLIEDCAQAHGARWKDKKAGNFGDISCFSFFPSKNLGAIGDAGAVCTDNEEFAERIKMYRNIGTKIKHVHESEWGGNSRLDEIQALVLNMKLPYLDKWNQRRREIASIYREELKDLPLIMYKEHPDAYHVYHQFVVMVKNREKVINYLEKNGIPVLIHYPTPCHKARAFIKYSSEPLPGAESISRHHLSLPMSPHLTNDEIKFVCKKLQEVLKDEERPDIVCS